MADSPALDTLPDRLMHAVTTPLRELEGGLRALADVRRHGVSIIIPVAGGDHRARLVSTMACLQRQIGTDIEVIVVAAPDEPEPQLSHHHNARIVVAESSESASGFPNVARLRNEGVRHSRGAYLLFCDADILLPSPTYIADLLSVCHRTRSAVVARPIRNRILDADVNVLARYIRNGYGLEDVLDPVMQHVFRHQGASGGGTMLALRRRGGQAEFVEAETLQRSLGANAAFRQCLWKGSIWGGGLLVPRVCFDFVTGYCEEFEGWGYEDADLLDRLRTVFSACLLYESRAYDPFQAFHLEHDMPHRTEAAFARNSALRGTRRTRDLRDLVLHDLRVSTSPYHRELAGRHPWAAS
jgi:hypothetical protein